MNVNSDRPERLTRREAKARTRARLLEAGTAVFEAEGFHGATVEAIAERAGFTRGAFYANFADKSDLLLTLLEERNRAGLDLLTDELAGTPSDHALPTVVRWFEQRFSSPSPLERALAELGPVALADAGATERLRRSFAATRERVAAMTAEGFADAGIELPVPAERFATMVIALVDGMAQLQRLDPDGVPSELLGEAIAYLGAGVLTADT
jgi:AcrR family transcriptional regulator